MHSKKSFGIAGVAMLGTVALLGTSAANAVVDLSGDGDDIIFAMETVTETVDEDRMYHKVNGASGTGTAVGLLDIVGVAGVGASAATDLIVTFTLDGMVFGETLEDGDIELYEVDSNGVRTTERTLDSFTRSKGGNEGDSEVVFSITTESGLGDHVVLRVPSLGVSSGGGTASMRVEFEHGLITASMAGPSNAVLVQSGASATGTTPTVVTRAARGYTDFGFSGGQPSLSRSLGRFSIDVDHLDAADGTEATIDDVFGAGSIDDTDVARVEFSGGRTDFAAHVWLEDDSACGDFEEGTDVDLIDRDNDGNNTGELVAAMLGDLDVTAAAIDGGNGRLFCIQAAGDPITIPATGPYEGTVTYQSPRLRGQEALDAETLEVSAALGRILRGDATVRLPYLTTDARYNQRIIMVNDGNAAATYSMTFTSEEAVDATPGADAQGTLPANSTTVLHLRKDDVVTIGGDGASRVSAELIIAADPGDISVATNQTNAASGGTDTVVYDVE